MPVYRKKAYQVEARQVTVGNLESIEAWSNGAIKGTKLPRDQRIIEIQNAGIEQRAEVGDWIVKEANGVFNVYTDEAFNLLHEGVNAPRG